MVSTLDSESSDPSSNLGGTLEDFFSVKDILKERNRDFYTLSFTRYEYKTKLIQICVLQDSLANSFI